jgi:hypothetical protein
MLSANPPRPCGRTMAGFIGRPRRNIGQTAWSPGPLLCQGGLPDRRPGGAVHERFSTSKYISGAGRFGSILTEKTADYPTSLGGR